MLFLFAVVQFAFCQLFAYCKQIDKAEGTGAPILAAFSAMEPSSVKIHQNTFEWLKFEQLEHEFFYPIFIKKAIFHLPHTFVIRTEYE